jgi:hypothetical protein
MTTDSAGQGPVERQVRPLVERLRDTPNWMRESYGSWKDCVLKYDRAPFEAADEIERVRAHLGCEGRDQHTDPVAAIKMIQGWEADAQRRAELLEQHLRGVLEIARTWQPNYATKMDRDTLDLAAAEVGERPNVEVS